MNIVKMQDSLKDLSDRQLMQTMEAGSSPQYLVLAEMQRRKKMREDSAQASPQGDRSVAEDIISGIAAVPTSPMGMAEGGIVSFAKGGKTGRMKGEEEACYVDSRTGEKYCPPSRPQTEMPRTGQRKSFQAGGDVGVSPDEMSDIDLQRARQVFEQNIQDLRSVDPDVDFETFLRSYNKTPVGAQTAPAPEEEQGFLGRAEEGVTSFLRGIAPGTRDPDSLEGTGEFSPAIEGSPTSESAAGLPFLRYKGEPVLPPVESVEEDLERRREQAPVAEQPAPADESPENEFTPPTPPTSPADLDPDPEVASDSGLTQLIQDLQSERQELREGSREDAINQALIRAGLTMAASDNPDFLSAAAEGGIGGLAGYQSAMESAAERQGDITSDVIDLGIARETAALKQRAAEAAMNQQITDEQYAELDLLQGQIEAINDQIANNPAMSDEEKDTLATRRNQLVSAVSSGMKRLGINVPTTGSGSEGVTGDQMTTR